MCWQSAAMSAYDEKLPSLPAIKRMPMYLRELRRMSQETANASASRVAELLGLEAIVVRKDLELAGVQGRAGIGYPIQDLILGIEDLLGWNNTSDAVLVGAGSLGTAILGYSGFASYGVNVVCAFDIDPNKVDGVMNEKPVLPLAKLTDLVARMHVRMGIITVPKEHAQAVADLMVESGIRAIWNFAPIKLSVPDSVVVQNEDLAEGLAVLSVKLKSRLIPAPPNKEK